MPIYLSSRLKNNQIAIHTPLTHESRDITALRCIIKSLGPPGKPLLKYVVEKFSSKFQPTWALRRHKIIHYSRVVIPLYTTIRQYYT